MDADIPIKPSFRDVLEMCKVEGQALEALPDKAGVSTGLLCAMIANSAVCRLGAERVLQTLSECTDRSWTLNNVAVVLMPTFKDLCTLHNLSLNTLAERSRVPFAIVERMWHGSPVPSHEARLVLDMASRRSRLDYTLQNVDVKLVEVP
jgi:hypothetical protein